MILVWSSKGGSGATVVACVLALRPSPAPSLLVDLAGDVPGALGLSTPAGPGIGDWLRSPTATGTDLTRLAVPGNDRVDVIHRGTQPPADAPWPRFTAALPRDRDVVVDAGTGEPPAALNDAAEHSLLVVRPCYLALQRSARLTVRPTGVVLIDEGKRALGSRDVEGAVGAPVVATVPFDPALYRAVDAGLLLGSVPRTIGQALRGAL